MSTVEVPGLYRDTSQTAHTVRARKRYRCDQRAFEGCRGSIQPGDDYVRCVAFPGHDCNDGSQPWVMRVCVGCYLPPLPARRSSRAKVVVGADT